MKYICLFLSLSLLSLSWYGCNPNPSQDTSWQTKLPAPKLKRMSYEAYGIDVKQMEVVQAHFERNQFVTDVLQDHKVPSGIIDQIARKSQQVFDVRKMRAGNSFTLLKSRQDQEVDYFIYEINDAEFVVFDLRDTVKVYVDTHEVISRQREVAGVIKSSLYEAFQEYGFDISLAKGMEEVYAWTVDFFHLEKGDHFKVIYEEQFVDEISIGISRILAAQIQHEGVDYHAFYFRQDSLESYFDLEGNSLRKEFLKAPLRFSATGLKPSSSEFPSRQSRMSVDFGAPQHTPVVAIGNGQITKIRRRKGHLNSISIRHSNAYVTEYMHLSKIEPELLTGQHIQQGEIIGYVGRPQRSSSHVRLQFYKNGRKVHPWSVDLPSTTIIQSDNQSSFEQMSRKYLERLNKISLDKATNKFAYKK
ncbi:MAG: peptidoglycan DD-metalloendopeptidase family protein [Bacteroidota bacterium]